MGPTIEVTPNSILDAQALDAIDDFLARSMDKIQRHRKGRSWEGYVEDRPIYVMVEDEITVILGAECKGTQDYMILRRLGAALAELLDGNVDEPTT